MKLKTLDKSRPYGAITGGHFVHGVAAISEQDGDFYDCEGVIIAAGPRPVVGDVFPRQEVKAEPKFEPDFKMMQMTTAAPADDTSGIDLEAYAEGHVKAPWTAVTKAVCEAYGKTPASKADAIKIIRAGK